MQNPYIAGKALGDARGFAGREDVFRLVQTVMSHPDSNSVVLFGQRRIGKTSILLNLRARLPSPPFVTIFFDLQHNARRPLGEVLCDLAQTIAPALKLPRPDPAHSRDDDGAWFSGKFLPSVYAALGESRRLVLLFDEFDVLDAGQEEQLPPSAAARSFIPYMRRLMVEQPRLGFVFVVGRKADELSIEFKAAFKAARYHRISALEEKDARHLILTAERNGSLRFAPGAPERVLALTAGHPYFTQLLCQLLFEQAWNLVDEAGAEACAPDAPLLITAEDVEAVIPRTLEAGENVFDWIWEGLPPAERIIFSAVAAGTDERTVITEERLLDVLQQQGVRILIRELELAPRTLTEWELLKTVDGGYRFYVELMRRWVALRKPPARVKDELDRINPLADTLYQGATGFYRSGDLERAVVQLQTALNVNPNHLKARLLLGDIYRIQGNHDQAVAELAEAYRISPDEARVPYEALLLQHAQECEKAQRLEDALAAYDRVLDLSPGNRVAQERRGPVAAAQAKAEHRALVEAAARFETEERWDDALAAYQRLQADSMAPKWAEAVARVEREGMLAHHYGQGLVYQNDRSWEDAQHELKQVVAERPAYKDAAARLELIAAARKQEEYALTMPKGRRWFIAAWLAAAIIPWLLVLAAAAVSANPGAAWFTSWWWVPWLIFFPPLWTLGLQVLLMRPFTVGSAIRKWGVSNAFLGLVTFVMLAFLMVGLSLIIELNPNVAWLRVVLLLFLPIAGVLIANLLSLLQVKLFDANVAKSRWIRPSVWGRVLGVGAGLRIIFWPWQVTVCGPLSALVARSEDNLSFALGGLAWGLISGVITANAMAGILVDQRAAAIAEDAKRSTAAAETAAAMIGIAEIVKTAAAKTATAEDVKSDAAIAAIAEIVKTTVIESIVGPKKSLRGVAIPPGYARGIQIGLPVAAGIATVLAVAALTTSVLALAQDAYPVRITGGLWNAPSYAPDSSSLAVGEDLNVTLLDPTTGERTSTLVTLPDWTGNTAWAPDGSRLAVTVGDSSALVIVDVLAQRASLTVTQEISEIVPAAVAYSPNGSRLLSGGGTTAFIYDAVSGARLLVLSGLGTIYAADWSPDSVAITVASEDNRVHMLDADTGRLLGTLEHGAPVLDVAYSPDGTYIATASGDAARIWDGRTRSLRLELLGHTANVVRVAWSPDGRMLASGGEDGTVRLWSTAYGHQLRELRGLSGGPDFLAFSPDGEQLVTGTLYGATLWYGVAEVLAGAAPAPTPMPLPTAAPTAQVTAVPTLSSQEGAAP